MVGFYMILEIPRSLFGRTVEIIFVSEKLVERQRKAYKFGP